MNTEISKIKAEIRKIERRLERWQKEFPDAPIFTKHLFEMTPEEYKQEIWRRRSCNAYMSMSRKWWVGKSIIRDLKEDLATELKNLPHE